jgi:hypothetical protein
MHFSPMVSPKDNAAVQEALVITKLPSGHASHEKNCLKIASLNVGRKWITTQYWKLPILVLA